MNSVFKKTRFVCISDTHNSTFKLPPGDVLIHAGDLTKQGTFAELKKTVEWIEKSDFEIKIVVAGNHDITLDRKFYAEYGANFHSQNPQDAEACVGLLQNSESITYLEHESKEIRLTKPTGPRTQFKVFGSPFSPAKGTWAFQYNSDTRFDGFDRIPLDADIVITHTPPKFHCDESKDKESSGCEALREVLWRVRPKLAICGHVHEARGAELITWDLENSNVTFKEESTTYWEDTSEGTKKQALIDLTAKGGNLLSDSHKAENHTDKAIDTTATDKDKNQPRKVKTNPTFSTSKPVRKLPTSKHVSKKNPEPQNPISSGDAAASSPPPEPGSPTSPKKASLLKRVSLANLRRSTSPRASSRSRSSSPTTSKGGTSNSPEKSNSVHQVGTAVRGRGGSPSSGRSDREALMGRLERRQTCVINTAIMATSWPYKGVGGERYNKPVVVDLDLSV